MSGRRETGERGSMAMEIVILAPIIIVFLLLLVGLGRVVEARGQVYGAARDAARAASISREPAVARLAADAAARRDLAGWCEERQPPTEVFGNFTSGGEISVRVSCTVDLAGLSVVGFTPRKLIRESVTAPLDTYYRAGGRLP